MGQAGSNVSVSAAALVPSQKGAGSSESAGTAVMVCVRGTWAPAEEQ